MSDYERFDAVLSADFSAGKLYWKERADNKAWNSRFAGKEAFTAKTSAGYHHGALSGKNYLAHRVLWLLHTGEWPEAEVDHINGNPADNRIANLRAATRSENARNSTVYGASRYKGVGKSNNRWVAQIDGIYLGAFKCETAAYIARRNAEARHGEFAYSLRVA